MFLTSVLTIQKAEIPFTNFKEIAGSSYKLCMSPCQADLMNVDETWWDAAHYNECSPNFYNQPKSAFILEYACKRENVVVASEFVPIQ